MSDTALHAKILFILFLDCDMIMIIMSAYCNTCIIDMKKHVFEQGYFTCIRKTYLKHAYLMYIYIFIYIYTYIYIYLYIIICICMYVCM